MCVVMSFTRRLERERKFRAVKTGLKRRGGGGGHFISLKLWLEGERSVERVKGERDEGVSSGEQHECRSFIVSQL